MMKNKTWTLTINQQPFILTLTPPSSRGYCSKCHLEKEIMMISERPLPEQPFAQGKKLCWSCALNNLYELEKSDFEIKNKKEVISEIREAIKDQPVIDNDEQPLECYG